MWATQKDSHLRNKKDMQIGESLSQRIENAGLTSEDSGVRWQGRWLVLSRTIWVAVSLFSIALYLASLPPFYNATVNFSIPHQVSDPQALRLSLAQLGISIQLFAIYFICIATLSVSLFLGVGGFIFWRKGNERAAWFFSIVLITFGVVWGNTLGTLSEALPILKFPITLLDVFGFATFFWLCYLFPDGRFVPRWTSLAAVYGFVQIALIDFFPGTPLDYNTWPPALFLASNLMSVGIMLFAPVYRYRRASTPTQRQQIKWVLFSLVTAILLFIGTAYLGDLPLFQEPGNSAALYFLGSNTVYVFAFLLIPIAIGIAILRYRLWNIDLIIRRTLVYGVLTACVVGGYAVVVSGLGSLFRTQGSLLISLFATGLIAVLFQPVRERVQRGVNRLTYGERDEPYSVLTRLSRLMETPIEPSAAMQLTVETIAHALKLPYVAILLQQGSGFKTVAEFGKPQPTLTRLPLIHVEEMVGELVVASRAPDEPLTPGDLRLLGDLTQPISLRAHAILLASDLERARLGIVAAQEETRRRLGRDLHDGLGHQLAALARKAERAAQHVEPNPEVAQAEIAEVTQDLNAAIRKVRELAHQLHPPELELLGLMGALREHIQASTDLRFQFEAPNEMPLLPAAIQTAAYYIVLEALNNVKKHARANSCQVKLEFTGGSFPLDPPALLIQIDDDGHGLPTERDLRSGFGLGLLSMQARAAEAGGMCRIESRTQGGTRVSARLPVPTLDG
jgi:signal transduction histidine kinase